MKLKAVLAVILLFSGIGFRAAAQYNIDYDIQAIRQLSFPEFINEFGNYTQYVPGVGLLTLKLSGVKGRTNWARFSTSVATSAILVAGASFGLKEITGRERPNGADKRSIPSGHSVLAFASAAALHKEYGWRSPWYSIGGYSFAMLTAVQRIATNWHWMGDTMFGMVLGIGGVELGYFLNDLFWKEK
ncbi:MAG: phosphatase PAP2 family protein, partial [Bacteroidales bacterium]|nr:phosphatase PAP2 family protein [Bacteroidales bacterium]